jgi:hypothetical protein
MTAGRIVLLLVGAFTAVIALGFLVGGVALTYGYFAERDDDGYFMTRHEELATPLFAVVSKKVDIESGTPDWLLDQLGDVRISARPESKPLFVGIGPSADVDRYLESVAHTRVVDLDFEPFRWETEQVPGPVGPTAMPEPPAEQSFWVASASGGDEVTVDWDVESGEWTATIMNADASSNVEAVVAGGAKAPILLPLGIALLAVGLILGVTAVFVIRLSLQREQPSEPVSGT